MARRNVATQSRVALDRRFATLGPAGRLTRPVRGWVKAIREALGMSTAQLAMRLSIKQPSLVAIEQSEERGTIRLATLQRVAEALGCTVVYALVPNKPLETLVHERAREVARRRLAAVDHTMLLEDQQVPAEHLEGRLESIARDIEPGALWDDE
ncbi:MAG TPA: mobile mystery protein A [Stellaceae bacterium]|nr:mobile mystery protein A [Stellaceae bacterium]